MSTEDAVIATAIYHEASATASMRGIPRFGASSDFSELFRSKEDATEYIVGLLFAGLFLFALFFAWSVCLLVFKCLGRKVGFLSGRAFVRPAEGSKCNRPFICRLVFLNATLLLIVFSVLFVTQGLTNLRTTVTTVADSVRNIYSTMEEVNTLMSRVELIGSNATNVASTFVRRLDNGGQECIVDELSAGNPNAASAIAEVRARIQELGNFTPENLAVALNTTEYYQNVSAEIEEETENIEIGDWQSLIIIIPYIIVPSFLLAGVCVAWFQIDIPMLRCVNSYFFLPLFVIMSVFAYFFSSIIAIVAGMNADFCSGGETRTPDGTMYSILAALGFSQDDLVLKAAVWYIGQCGSSEDPFDFLEIYEQQVAEAKLDVAEFTLQLENAGNNAVSQFCSDESNVLKGLATTLNTNMVELVKIIEESLDLLSCKNMVILYTKPVYEGTCTYSITGFAWAFGAFAAVASMGLTMIMLRSAWQLDTEPEGAGLKEIEVANKTGEDEYDEDDEYGYSPGNEEVQKSDDDADDGDDQQEQEQPAGGGGYGTLDDDGGDDFGGMEEQDDGKKEDDFFSQRASNKVTGDPY